MLPKLKKTLSVVLVTSAISPTSLVANSYSMINNQNQLSDIQVDECSEIGRDF